MPIHPLNQLITTFKMQFNVYTLSYFINFCLPIKQYNIVDSIYPTVVFTQTFILYRFTVWCTSINHKILDCSYLYLSHARFNVCRCTREWHAFLSQFCYIRALYTPTNVLLWWLLFVTTYNWCLVNSGKKYTILLVLTYKAFQFLNTEPFDS